jgi:general stress protein 26
MRCATFMLACATAAAHAQSPAKDRAAALAIMQAARYCTFVTNGIDGQPQSRIVDPLIASEGSIWIATNPRSRKVAEVARDSRVTLTFFNTKANEFVTVIGRARQISDSAEKARHWKADWSPFYKQKWRGADFMLFEVRAARLEVVSPGRGIMNDSLTWRPRVIDIPTIPSRSRP